LRTRQETPVASSTEFEVLADVSGGRIIYTTTPLDPEWEAWDRVQLYSTATGSVASLTPDMPWDVHQPRIGQDIAAWVVTQSGLPEIKARVVPDGEVRSLYFPAPHWANTSPAIDSGLVVWSVCEPLGTYCTLAVHDWASGTTRDLLRTDGRSPDISGYRVVYLDQAGRDVRVYDLGTDAVACHHRNAGAGPARISGDFVAFVDGDLSDSSLRVHLWHVPTGLVFPIRPGQQTLKSLDPSRVSIDGNRVVYADRRYGARGIFMYEFQLIGTLAVSPSAYSFGDVTVGNATSTIVTISNASASGDVSVSDISFEVGSSGDFRFVSIPSLPITLRPGETLDVDVAFSPTDIGPTAAVLRIASNDPNHLVTAVPLSGTGVQNDTPVSFLVNLLEWFDASVANGTLVGNGNGNSAGGRLGALRNMLEAAGTLIENAYYPEACDQLQDAHRRADGIEPPPDFVKGSAAALLGEIAALRAQLGCE
jgi:hypothetical protein